MTQTRDNTEWLQHLRASGPQQDQAIQDLSAWLQQKLFFYLRQRNDLSHLHGDELRAMSHDFAQESVIIILQKLDQFQGRSRFTTWAARIAVHQALAELRRARWRDLSLQQITRDGAFEPDFLHKALAPTPEQSAIQQEAMAAVMDVMTNELSEKQRQALYARMVWNTPTAVLAEEMGVSHNTLYKLIHDARKRLRKGLLARGLSPEDLLASFD